MSLNKNMVNFITYDKRAKEGNGARPEMIYTNDDDGSKKERMCWLAELNVPHWRRCGDKAGGGRRGRYHPAAVALVVVRWKAKA